MESQMLHENNINSNHHPTGMLDRDQRTARTAKRLLISDTIAKSKMSLLYSDCCCCKTINNNSSNYCNKAKISSCQLDDKNTIESALSSSPSSSSGPKMNKPSLLTSESVFYSSSNSCYTRKCDNCNTSKDTAQKLNINSNEFHQSSSSSLSMTVLKRSTSTAPALKSNKRHYYRFLPKSCRCKFIVVIIIFIVFFLFNRFQINIFFAVH